MKQSPYQIIRRLHVTEKTSQLRKLEKSESSKSLKACNTPKYVFVVDPTANKQQIKAAVQEIYKEKNVKVLAVNTIRLKPKAKRRRGRPGKTALIKKAIVTLAPGDSLDTMQDKV